MDRTSAGKAIEGRDFRRGEIWNRPALQEQTPGLVVFVVSSKLQPPESVVNGPMVLNSVDDKVATFLSSDEQVKFLMKDSEGRQHISACWSIFEGYDVRLYEAIEVL